MTKNIKNILGLALIISVLIFSYAFLKYSNSYNKKIQPSSFRSFSVSAEAKVEARPDIAQFNIQIINEGDKNVTNTQKKNSELSNKIISFLKKEGIKDKDIKTKNYNITPRYQRSDCRFYSSNTLSSNESNGKTCPPPSIVGYTIRQSITVKIHDFNKIGDIMKGVVKNGANSISSLSFTIDDPSSLQDKARAEAIAKAKKKAEEIAKAGNFKLGKLLGIQEGYQASQKQGMYLREGINNGSFDFSPIINPGSQEVKSTVTLRYEIQ